MKELIEGRRGERDGSSAQLAEGNQTPARGVRIGGIILGIGVLLGGAGGYMLAQAQRIRTPITEAGRALSLPIERGISVERQVAAQRLAALPEVSFSATDPPAIVLSGFDAPIRFSPPFDVIDSALFDSGDRRIRLARIVPVGRQDVCLDGDGRRFACGLMGRATLQNLLAHRSVSCVRLFLPANRRHDFIDADCDADGVNIAEHVVRSGFAFPSALTDERLEAALGEAREAQNGVWRGPYLIPEKDAALEDAREVEISSFRTSPSVARDRVEDASGNATGMRRMEGLAERHEAASRAKKRVPSSGMDGSSPSRPIIPSPRSTGPIEPVPAAKAAPHAGVVAGPILPPPEALARKLGLSPSTTGGEPGDPTRGTSDR